MSVIDITTAAKEIGCDPSTVRRWRQRLQLGRKVGSCWWINRAELTVIQRHVRESPGNPTGWKAVNRAKQQRKLSSTKDL